MATQTSGNTQRRKLLIKGKGPKELEPHIMQESETPSLEKLDCLQPELLSDKKLTELLQNHRVPCKDVTHRNDLLKLFNEHVRPKPQRLKRKRNTSIPKVTVMSKINNLDEWKAMEAEGMELDVECITKLPAKRPHEGVQQDCVAKKLSKDRSNLLRQVDPDVLPVKRDPVETDIAREGTHPKRHRQATPPSCHDNLSTAKSDAAAKQPFVATPIRWP